MNLREAQTKITEHMEANGLRGQGWLAKGNPRETEWRFEFDRATRRFGSCDYLARKITMSRALVELNDWAEVEQTALHEIAHAIVGPMVKAHGWEWKAQALRLGHHGARCYSSTKVKTPEHRWIGVCPTCDKKTRPRARRGRLACTPCMNKSMLEAQREGQRRLREIRGDREAGRAFDFTAVRREYKRQAFEMHMLDWIENPNYRG